MNDPASQFNRFYVAGGRMMNEYLKKDCFIGSTGQLTVYRMNMVTYILSRVAREFNSI